MSELKQKASAVLASAEGAVKADVASVEVKIHAFAAAHLALVAAVAAVVGFLIGVLI